MNFRKELSNLKRVVVKVGSSVITKNNGKIDSRKIRKIVEDISDLIDQGLEVVLVSSGAVSLGKDFLKKYLPQEGRIDLQHSASSIGQPKLINTYSRIFEENQKVCSQILLTHDDFRDRRRFLHTKQNINVLLRNGVIPILNENDSISYTENTVGDNDQLAAQTAQMINADLLLMITSTDGLYEKDPGFEGAQKIDFVSFEDNIIDQIDYRGKTAIGRGGMLSKVQAIAKITPLGIQAIISSKNEEKIIIDPLCKNIGTYFAPKNHYDPEERKAWVLSMKKVNCFVEVDKGAYIALIKSKSLFPTGIISVSGDFYKGDCIDITFGGKVFASGVCEYGNEEIQEIMGSHSNDIEAILGFKSTAEVVHTINLVIQKDLKDEKAS
jgi:glutamate 5-kinase